MLKEEITSRQTIIIIIMFIFGSSVIMGVNTDAKQDSWISLFIALVLALTLVLIYARILKLFPGKGLFDIIDILFGKVLSRILIILMTWYAFHLGSVVIADFFEFIEITTLQYTPNIVLSMTMVFISVYIARSSISTFGKWGVVTFSIVLLMVIITIIFSIGNMNMTNFLPIFEHSPIIIIESAMKILSFPFAEIVLLLPLAGFIKKNESPYKIFTLGIGIGGLILLLIVVRNLVTLGAPLMTNSFFPSYTAARVIELGEFLTRIEGVVAINFVLAGITKITVCLIAAAKGLAKLFDVKKHKDLALPVGLVMLALSLIMFHDIFELFEFTNQYLLFVFQYQFIIPIIIWIAAEIKTRKLKTKN